MKVSPCITITSEDAIDVLQSGADAVAIDCTLRDRPEPIHMIFEK